MKLSRGDKTILYSALITDPIMRFAAVSCMSSLEKSDDAGLGPVDSVVLGRNNLNTGHYRQPCILTRTMQMPVNMSSSQSAYI